jgi:Flp pilus assembly protein TadG
LNNRRIKQGEAIMLNNRWKDRKKRRGSVAVELALTGPLLLLMLIGAADFARVFYHAVTLANAAGTGAFYGAQNNITSGQFTQMQDVAQTDAKDLGAITATAGRYCDCPSGTKVDCVTGACAGYGAPRVYVSTQTRESFSPLVGWTGIPNPVTAGRTAYMRVQ